MNANQFIDAFGEIGESFVEEAGTDRTVFSKKKKGRIVALLSSAACVAVIIGSVILTNQLGKNTDVITGEGFAPEMNGEEDLVTDDVNEYADTSYDFGNATLTQADSYAQSINPMTEMGSIEELEVQLGFDMPQLENLTAESIFMYNLGQDDSLGEINYNGGITLRKANYEGDCSGIYGSTLPDSTIEGITVHFGECDGSVYAWWEIEPFAYSVSSESGGTEKVAVFVSELLD